MQAKSRKPESLGISTFIPNPPKSPKGTSMTSFGMTILRFCSKTVNGQEEISSTLLPSLSTLTTKGVIVPNNGLRPNTSLKNWNVIKEVRQKKDESRKVAVFYVLTKKKKS